MKYENEVYSMLLRIPKGCVTTYGDMARALGDVHLARVVGNILHKNPAADKYSCYKVVNSKGKLSRSYAFGGIDGQRERLLADGVEVEHDTVDFEKYCWRGFF